MRNKLLFFLTKKKLFIHKRIILTLCMLTVYRFISHKVASFPSYYYLSYPLIIVCFVKIYCKRIRQVIIRWETLDTNIRYTSLPEQLARQFDGVSTASNEQNDESEEEKEISPYDFM